MEAISAPLIRSLARTARRLPSRNMTCANSPSPLAEKIIETVKGLHDRIEERFPGSGLGKVIGELQQVAEETVERTRWIQQPRLLLRCARGGVDR